MYVRSWPLNKGKLKISFMFKSVFVFDTMFVFLFDAIFVLCWPLWDSKVGCASRIGEPRTSNPPYHLLPKIICYIERWFLIICIKQVYHIHISAILYNAIWKRSIQYISNELNIIIWTPCRYQHYQHFIIFFQSDPTFGSSGASLAKLCHRANCGFPRIAPAWSTIFFNQ